MTPRQAIAQSGLVPLEAQVLLAHVLGVDRAWLVGHATDDLAPAAVTDYFALVRRRVEGEPVAYLTGTREFWGLALAVTRNVLIPRPETETLVEVALARLSPDRDLAVLDLGTGSGAIALALAHERRRARIVAVDASAAALEVARANARRLSLPNVAFLRSDWYAALPAGEGFDAIVSNPPYIAAQDAHLAQGDLPHEPRAALTPGGDGLSALRAIVAGARARLRPGGTLAVEHGYDQAAAVRELFETAGFVDLASTRDLAGIPRVASGRCP